jgi:hypothetical protein
MHQSPFTRESELTPEAVTSRVRQQLADDCELGLATPRPDDELDRIAAHSVQVLWDESRIKTFLPVLAIRHARDAIRATSATS